jgi:hypothetical protein
MCNVVKWFNFVNVNYTSIGEQDMDNSNNTLNNRTKHVDSTFRRNKIISQFLYGIVKVYRYHIVSLFPLK